MVVIIFVSLAVSHTLVYTARLWIQG